MTQVFQTPMELTALRWSGGWEEMSETARSIGAAGIAYEVKFTQHPENPQQEDIFPELVLVDRHWQPHKVYAGEVVILYPDKSFRVVTKREYNEQYERKE